MKQVRLTYLPYLLFLAKPLIQLQCFLRIYRYSKRAGGVSKLEEMDRVSYGGFFFFFLMVISVLWMGSCGREGREGRGEDGD